MKRWKGSFLVGAISVLLAASAAGAGGGPVWSYQSKEELKWQAVTFPGLVMAATENELLCLDPGTGNQLWKRDDLKKITEYQVQEIEGSPLLLVTANLKGSKTKLLALDVSTGNTVWSTERLKGASVGVVPIPERDFVLLLTSKKASAEKDKIDLIALRLSTGEVLWENEFADKVDLHLADASRGWSERYDLSGHQPPLYDGDSLYFTYAGLHRHDMKTGKLVWGLKYDVTEGKLKRGNAQAVIDGGVIYTAAKGEVRAIDKSTGALRWKSADFGAAVAETILDGDFIFARMGGTFFDYDEREWKLKKPLGVAAVHKRTGATIWKFDKAQLGITNMMLMPAQNALLVADGRFLIGLDTTVEGRGAELFRVKLEFKMKLNAGYQAARISSRMATTPIYKLPFQRFHDEDVPVVINRRENGLMVVQGRQHLLAFDPATKQIPWSLEFAAPGQDAWKALVMTALAAAAAYGNARAYETGSQSRMETSRTFEQIGRDYEKWVSRRFSTTRSGGRFTYVLTRVASGDKLTPGVVGVNLDTGDTSEPVPLGEKEPNYRVDEVLGRLYHIRGKRELVAFSLQEPVPEAETAQK